MALLSAELPFSAPSQFIIEVAIWPQFLPGDKHSLFLYILIMAPSKKINYVCVRFYIFTWIF